MFYNNVYNYNVETPCKKNHRQTVNQKDVHL